MSATNNIINYTNFANTTCGTNGCVSDLARFYGLKETDGGMPINFLKGDRGTKSI